jgi:hypothetical protein
VRRCSRKHASTLQRRAQVAAPESALSIVNIQIVVRFEHEPFNGREDPPIDSFSCLPDFGLFQVKFGLF